ncbi:MAG: hypothetical protein ACIRZH_09980, partial [Ligilactobacillus ruminis]
ILNLLPILPRFWALKKRILLFPQIADTSAEFFCIKSHCSILSFAPKTQTGRDSFSESRPVFSLKMHNDRDSMELLL